MKSLCVLEKKKKESYARENVSVNFFWNDSLQLWACWLISIVDCYYSLWNADGSILLQMRKSCRQGKCRLEYNSFLLS